MALTATALFTGCAQHPVQTAKRDVYADCLRGGNTRQACVVIAKALGQTASPADRSLTPSPAATASPTESPEPTATPEPRPTTHAQYRYDKGAIHAKIVRLVNFAQALSFQAATIVDETPSSETQADWITGNDGRKFYAADQDLQSKIDNFPKGAYVPDIIAIGDLAEAEQFLYATVSDDLTTCNERDARENLRVANAYLSEVKRDLAGTASSDWNAPDITGDDADECRQ